MTLSPNTPCCLCPRFTIRLKSWALLVKFKSLLFPMTVFIWSLIFNPTTIFSAWNVVGFMTFGPKERACRLRLMVIKSAKSRFIITESAPLVGRSQKLPLKRSRFSYRLVTKESRRWEVLFDFKFTWSWTWTRSLSLISRDFIFRDESLFSIGSICFWGWIEEWLTLNNRWKDGWPVFTFQLEGRIEVSRIYMKSSD